MTDMQHQHTRSRHRERGQVLPIVALAAVVLIGATALAVDLSLQTNVKRQIQNIADSAALAGVRDLYSNGTSVTWNDQTTAVADALTAITDTTNWTLTNQQACSGYTTAAMNQFQLTGQCEQANYPNGTLTVSTPPVTPSSVVDLDNHDVEVDITQTGSTDFAAMIGFASSSEKAHAVARHGAGGVVNNFALFANRYIQTGNSISVVNGNVYAGRAVDLQASGQASFCANRTSPSADDGYILLGAPQQGDPALPGAQTPGQWDMKPTTSRTIVAHDSFFPTTTGCTVSNLQTANLLTGNLLGYVVQSGPDVQGPAPSCPSIPAAGVAYYNANVGACEVTPIVLPPAPFPPTPTTVYGSPSGSGTGCKTGHEASCWRTAPSAGVYAVYHATSCVAPNCYDLQITRSMNISAGVTVWLKPGATFDINLNGGSGSVTFAGPYNAGTGAAGDDRYVVFGESGSSFSIHGGGLAVQLTTGSIYMPAGSVACADSSANLTLLAGQAVADTWNVSSGDQPNPQITFNNQYAGVSTETLRLVE